MGLPTFFLSLFLMVIQTISISFAVQFNIFILWHDDSREAAVRDLPGSKNFLIPVLPLAHEPASLRPVEFAASGVLPTAGIIID